MPEHCQGHRKRFLIAAAILGLVLVALLGPIRSRIGGQRVQGRSLNNWLEQLWSTNRAQAEFAIQEMGTNIVPKLQRKLEREHSLVRSWYRANWPAFPKFVQDRLTAPAATEDTQEPIYRALRALGPPVVPCILGWLQHPDVDVHSVAMRVIEDFGPAASAAVASLAKMLDDPDGERRNRAVYALAIIGNGTNGAVPVLARIARGSINVPEELSGTAAWALGRMREEAKESVPSLTVLLGSTNAYARVQAEVALWRIDSATNMVPRLIAELEQAPNTSICVDILQALADSKPAIELVRKRLDSRDWSGRFRREILDMLRRLGFSPRENRENVVK